MDLDLSLIESLDVEDLLTLPKGFRYELHDGNLVIMSPATYWHKEVAARFVQMLRAAGSVALQDPGVRGERPRDCRLPDFGVLHAMPPNRRKLSNLPGSAFLMVGEVVSENTPNGEFYEKMRWYAEQGIPEYWIAEETPEGDDEDALVHLHRLLPGDGYKLERSLLLSELEAEYRAR